jgi:selenocysteine-specific elongation factor
MAKHIVMGTAGHVDHGKTALVKALTGIDTDRLKEEKERGITIELGFASLALPSGQMLSVVDVPGHERFIRNMVSGASGIDFVVMVIAADEGIMPQTKEHLAICTFLGIRRGVVALTKIDLVDEEWLALVMDDIRNFLHGTFLEAAPIVPVSAVTGAGLPDLVAALEASIAGIEEHDAGGIFRLSVDRIFTMKGFGTVVTGTVTGGVIGTGESVEVMPGGIQSRIRGMQVHNTPVLQVEAGQRTAINLQGLEKTTITRGDVVCRPGTLTASQRLDVRIELLAGGEKKLKNRALVRFHTGTSEIIARVILLDRDELNPGEAGYAQVIHGMPLVAMAKDRFVMRSYSPVMTIAGGEIIDPLPRKHKRFSPEVIKQSDLLLGGTDRQKVETLVVRTDLGGITIRQLQVRTGIHEARLREIVAVLTREGEIVVLDGDEGRAIASSHYGVLQQRIIQELAAYHRQHPLREGLSKEELRITVGHYVNPKLFQAALKHLERAGQIVVDRDTVHLAEHRVTLAGDLEDLRSEITALYDGAGFAPPTLKEVMEKFSDRRSRAADVIGVMLKEGTLIKISEDLYFHRHVLQRLREDYRALILKDGKATPTTFKELTGLSRKFIIPLMEYFDAAKLTIRAGDHRILRER